MNELEILRRQNEKLRECLTNISKTDVADTIDSLWLSRWRNEAKKMADEVLKECEEMEEGR